MLKNTNCDELIMLYVKKDKLTNYFNIFFVTGGVNIE